MPIAEKFSRRRFLAGVAASPLLLRGQTPSVDHGLVKPSIPVPNIALRRQDGSADSLPVATERYATALQLMFTECTTTCPMEGAVFERVQDLIPDQVARAIQLISLSVDPRNDPPQALAAWLGRFHARPGWIAAVPPSEQLEQVRAFFGAGRSPSDNHSTRVHLINRSGRVVWRTGELPSAEEIAGILQKM